VRQPNSFYRNTRKSRAEITLMTIKTFGQCNDSFAKHSRSSPTRPNARFTLSAK
jgi:hypothetical protein